MWRACRLTHRRQALRCRSLQWWRWRQECRRTTADKWGGPRPRRFKIRRSEEHLAEHFGDGVA
eukprot:14724541-Alexandrium_andersonii.AAC.1